MDEDEDEDETMAEPSSCKVSSAQLEGVICPVCHGTPKYQLSL
jgi:hypothetical protein